MPPVTLKGINVDFPFTPYECQKDYMSKVIECLQNKVNGVLESPTGTGKTLCLLCATLAWKDYFKDTISARKIAEKMGGAELFPNTPLASWGTAATDGDTTTYYTDIPKIIYASRTHSQLTQVINELKNTSYRPKVCVLGSREQLCINPEVMRQESNHLKVHMCRQKISTRSCAFYNNVEEKSMDKDLVNSILDVEDLVKAGNKQRVCPYYLSRSLKQQAEIIFMPYNYLLDPKSRRAHNIELKGAVVIFDEAHNVEKMCEESTSFDLTPYDLASAIDAVDKLLAEQAKEAGRGDVSEDFNMESINGGLKLDITTIAKIKQILLDLEAAIDSYDVPDKGITKPGSFIYELFQTAHLTFDTRTPIFEALEQITGYLAGKPGIFMNTTGLQKLADIIQLVFCVDTQEGNKGANMPLNMQSSTTKFKVHIHKDTSHHQKKQNTDVWSSSSSKKQVNLGRVVPHGLLVFFPSYPVMDKTLEFWRANGHADRIENIKPMFVEPRGKGTFTEIIDGYYDKVNDSKSKGGSFFAVCRGKASEGLDFADTYGRGVIITGLPFPPRMDPRVILKMQYLDEMCRKKTPGVQYLSGQNWYRQQASRAVNQAIGRVIRHRDDYGAIFLCDHRFKSTDARAQLPSWIRPYVRTYDNFGNVVRDVAQFFRVAQKHRPPPEKKPAKGSCGGAVHSADAQCVSAGPCHSSESSTKGGFAQKAKVLDSHVPSLKRRRLNEHGGSEGNGMARLCIEYETEMEASRRRPAGLLDALEHSDSRYGDEDEALGGEERANRISTLSLQYDKRVDDELRGGKRKIKVVQERKIPLSPNVSEGKAGKAKSFLAEMKRSLSQVNFQRIMAALQTYKQMDDLDKLLAEAADLFTGDTNTYNLLRGFYQFIRPHHKKRFDEKCVELTGQGCGYKPDHSLSKEEKETLMQNGAKPGKLTSVAVASDSSSSCSQLNASLLLNKGGHHLGIHRLTTEEHLPKNKVLTVDDPKCEGQAPVQSAQKSQIYASFIADVKKSIGLEKSNQLFSAIQSYKKTDNYDSLVGTVVSLLTEKNEDFNLLSTFALFIRPHHKKQYKEMLDALIGDSTGSSASSEISGQLIKVSTPGKAQRKISSFFPSSQRK
uniref:Regulator of telomere elongation helicase 1 n=1 Tax=Oncorhynchus kisutch TaxID=8019 RepID=A0A8C7H901_ONCKI